MLAIFLFVATCFLLIFAWPVVLIVGIGVIGFGAIAVVLTIIGAIINNGGM